LFYLYIYNNNVWTSPDGTKSGLGSSHNYTNNISKKLINFINENNINNMVDTSCGDWNWMKLIKNDLCNYVGIDIVKNLINSHKLIYENEKINFINTDFLSYLKNQSDNSIDLILCRHTLEHLKTSYNIEFINECKRVCKYLFLTGYNNIEKLNSELPNSIYRPINLKLAPYYNILNEYYLEEFYDGPMDKYLSEMYMYIYKFN